MTKTRQSHPLNIDTLPLPEGRGAIGIIFCPGQCDLGASSSLRSRDLGLDLNAIRDWGAHALVTLLEDHEFDLLHVRKLGDMAEAIGLEWHHLPIRDMAPPDWQFERGWLYSGLRLRRLLRRGGRVVIHCRAGLGRAGTVTARLLAELGVPAAEAVSQVRRARPGAIQTTAQETHVYTAHPISEQQDRVSGKRLACLLGGALGDGFGYPVKSRALDEIRKKYGPAGLREPRLRSGELVVSDATQMALFTLEGLTRALRGPAQDDASLVEQVRLSYLDWLETQGKASLGGGQATTLLKHATLHVRRDPNPSCLQALHLEGRGTPEQPINASQDSGGVTRVAPVALMPGMRPERAFSLGVRAAALTHGHPGGYLPAGILAAATSALLEEAPLQSAFLQAQELARTWAGHESATALVQQAIEAAIRPHAGALPPALGQGRSGQEALAIGLYAASRSLDFREVMAIAANHDGDSAASAGIAGQLFGAQHGLEALPHAWVRRLDVLEAVCDLADWTMPLWKEA